MKTQPLGILPLLLGTSFAEPVVLHQFERLQLTDTYYSEGANFGKFNQDEHPDVVSGPYWYEGPDFTTKHEIYPPKAQNLQGYADNFFSFTYDFNRDGLDDVFVVGFPGTPGAWYENPGEEGGHWERHEVIDSIANESPHFTQLVGDDQPELVCTRQGSFGYATFDPEAPEEPWKFHPISLGVAHERFGHGLGVGDINGDGRLDIIAQNGWYKQPESLEEVKLWAFHEYDFTRAGGAQMYAYDVNGDGLQDVITSLNAHGYGLAWFEQTRTDEDAITFTPHLIMGNRPDLNPYGLVFSELHAVELVDMDGDGLRDIVTGKTFWSHHTREPGWHDGAVIYWFKLVREEGEARFIPHLVDDNSGVGRQVVVGQADQNPLPDIVTANMKGTFVLRHRTVEAPEGTSTEPPLYTSFTNRDPEGTLPTDGEGRSLNFDFETGDLTDWLPSGKAFEGQPTKGEIRQDRKFGEGKSAKPQGEFWIGGFEIHEDDEPTGTLTSAPFELKTPYVSYLIGGGSHVGTRMEILSVEGDEENNVLFATHGRNSETMFPETVDVSAHIGKKVMIRLVDEQSDGFGHINFDNFRFHEELPVFTEAVTSIKRMR